MLVLELMIDLSQWNCIEIQSRQSRGVWSYERTSAEIFNI